MTPPTGYVLYICVKLQDGHEEYTKCFAKLADAIAYMNHQTWGDCNLYYRLFELGKEIPLDTYQEEEPQPAKTITKYRVKQ